MKRVALLTIFFYCCTFAAPQRSDAAVPLALIAGVAIGAVMLSSSAGTYYAQTGQSPQWVAASASVASSMADAIFQPSYLAQAVGLLFTPQSLNTAKDYYVGKAAAVGATIQDIADYVATTAESAYSSLKALIAANTVDTGLTESQFFKGIVFQARDGMRVIIEDFVLVGTDPYSYYNMNAAYEESLRPGSRLTPYIHTSGEWVYKFIPNVGTFSARTVITTTGDPITSPPPYINGAGLSDALKTPSSEVQNDLKDAIKNLPNNQKIAADSVPSTVANTAAPSAITQAAIQAALAANTAAVAAQVAAQAAEAAAANPTDAAAQLAAAQAAYQAAQAAQVAQAAENAAEQPEEETFSPISDSPFGTAYKPGEFDIPARFTTFLQNVKSSGLFSFSTAFFNSLPGGGSPLLTINGGQTFGTHTFDFSQSLGGGLAILKSVLLALFGFLSIRAIIMKR